MAKVDLSYIAEDLRPLAVDITLLDLLMNNPKKGDIPSVMASYETFGQRKPIVARRDPDGSGRGMVLAGNTQLQAARRLGWTHIAVTWVDDDDKTAAAFALADNRTADLGSYDDEALILMLQQVEDIPDLLAASGYDLLDMQDLMDGINHIPDFNLDDGGRPDISEFETGPIEQEPTREHGGGGRPVIQYALVFTNEEQQQRFYTFIKRLKQQYPDEATVADRLDIFLQNLEDDF